MYSNIELPSHMPNCYFFFLNNKRSVSTVEWTHRAWRKAFNGQLVYTECLRRIRKAQPLQLEIHES